MTSAVTFFVALALHACAAHALNPEQQAAQTELLTEALSTELRECFRGHERFFTQDHRDELAETIATNLRNLRDEGLRAQLIENSKKYIIQRRAIGGQFHVKPQDGNTVSTFYRPPAAWDLFKYELGYRLRRAASQPKSRSNIEAMYMQIDSMVFSARLPLDRILRGPGGPAFQKRWLNSFRDKLRYYAKSSLEELFPRPLTDAELRELQNRLETYVRQGPRQPQRPGFPQGPGNDSSTIWVKDGEQSPRGAKGVTDFGIMDTTLVYLNTFIAPQDFNNDKGLLERAIKMGKESDALAKKRRTRLPAASPADPSVDESELTLRGGLGSENTPVENEGGRASEEALGEAENLDSPTGADQGTDQGPGTGPQGRGWSVILILVGTIVIAITVLTLRARGKERRSGSNANAR